MWITNLLILPSISFPFLLFHLFYHHFHLRHIVTVSMNITTIHRRLFVFSIVRVLVVSFSFWHSPTVIWHVHRIYFLLPNFFIILYNFAFYALAYLHFETSPHHIFLKSHVFHAFLDTFNCLAMYSLDNACFVFFFLCYIIFSVLIVFLYYLCFSFDRR